MKVQEIVRAARQLAEPPEGLWSKIKAGLVSEQLLPVIKVADLFDPFKACPWNHFKFRLSDVRIAIEDGRFQPLPVPDNKRKMNIERIAWFVVNGWSDPISIDVGVPQLQGWNGEHLLDGWHRLGAAIYRKDQDILATVDGSVEYCQEVFNRTTIRLTQGYFATIDEEDFERVSKHKWYAVVERKDNSEILNIYAHTHLKEGTKSLPLHRFLLGLTDPKIVVDHKDHDGLNNKKKNIRPTTDQNQRNQRKGALNTSGYKGVVKSWNKWRAVIRHEKGKRMSLGSFSSKIEAAKAYDLAAIKYHGDFANLNFPKGG